MIGLLQCITSTRLVNPCPESLPAEGKPSAPGVTVRRLVSEGGLDLFRDVW